jgi:hypothetical protein
MQVANSFRFSCADKRVTSNRSAAFSFVTNGLHPLVCYGGFKHITFAYFYLCLRIIPKDVGHIVISDSNGKSQTHRQHHTRTSPLDRPTSRTRALRRQKPRHPILRPKSQRPNRQKRNKILTPKMPKFWAKPHLAPDNYISNPRPFKP